MLAVLNFMVASMSMASMLPELIKFKKENYSTLPEIFLLLILGCYYCI